MLILIHGNTHVVCTVMTVGLSVVGNFRQQNTRDLADWEEMVAGYILRQLRQRKHGIKPTIQRFHGKHVSFVCDKIYYSLSKKGRICGRHHHLPRAFQLLETIERAVKMPFTG